MEHLGEAIDHLLEELAVHNVITQPFTLTNYMVFLLLAFGITLTLFLIASRRTSAQLAEGDYVPKGVAGLVETGYEFVRDNMAFDVIGPEGRKYVPFIVTVFFFVLINNLLGLVPGFKPGTGTIGTTATWGVMVFIVYNAIGIKKNGALGYLKSFYPKGVPAPIAVFVAFLEVISHFLRPATLAIRLFANMYAGHVILGIFAIFTSLLLEASGFMKGVAVLPLIMQIIMYAFEVFVALIQAYVFSILTTVYIAGAVHASEH